MEEHLGALRGVGRFLGLGAGASEAMMVIFRPMTFCSTSALRRAAHPSRAMLAPARRGVIRSTSFFCVNSAMT